MICPRCGRQLLDSATFCPDCGAPIESSASDAQERYDSPNFDVSFDEFDDETQLMDSPAVDMSEFDDSGMFEELGNLDELGGPETPAVVAEEATPAHAAPSVPVVEDEAAYEPPLTPAVPPMSFETEVYQPVYPAGTPAYSAAPYTQNGPEDESYDDGAYEETPYGYAGNEPFDVIYAAPESVVPSTYANVKPIAGGVPTDHYLSRRRRRRRKLVSFIILLVFLLIVGGVAWYTWDQEMWGGKRVPQLVGLTEDGARSALTVKGLTAEVDPVPADAGFGIVLGSEPAEGQRCATDQPVMLQIASERRVPNVVGMTSDAARDALAEEGATNVILTYANSSAEEGTVIAVDPAPDTTFVSADPITITIAQPYTVPEVEGKTISEAVAAVEAAGLRYQVEYYQSWATRDTIIKVSPEAGTRVDENATVTLVAPIPYPATVYELPYYYRITPQQISSYLNYLNYTLEQGGYYTTGEGYERWTGATGDVISFTNEPESSSGPYGTTDVLAEGAEWNSVRYQCAKGSAASKLEVSEKSALTIARACGLSGDVTDSCTQETITVPYTINRNAYDFVCIQGEYGDYVWVVLISRGKSVTNTVTTPTTSTQTTYDANGAKIQTTTVTNVTTTSTTPADKESTVILALMPKETTDVSGLSSYGDSFCDYFAYANLYSSNR